MKIKIQVSTSDRKVGENKYLEINSVWNESEIIEMIYEDKKIKINGYELLESIRRVVGRPLFNRD